MTETNALLSALDKQQTQLEQLKELLETELHLISTREPESLINLVKDKEGLLEAIHSQDKQIEQTYLKLSDSDKNAQAIQDGFDKAKQLVEHCKYRTEINQKAVEQGQLRLEHLRTLLIESRAKENMTYDKSGKPQGKSSGKGYTA